MSSPDLESIIEALRSWHPSFYPRNKDLSKVVSLTATSTDRIDVRIQLGYPARRSMPLIIEQVEEHLRQSCPGLGELSVDIEWQVSAHAVQRQLTVSKRVRNVIAVGSGKGGVGKSTVATNLALAMAAEGARVGLLDADIYGPSQPKMLGINQAPQTEDDKTLIPLQAHGIQVMSVGFLVEDEKPIIWRGPMVSGALSQLFDDCAWDELDYLIIDLPPGTGDVQLTLAQRIPVTGAIIVSTPQQIAVSDARKSVKMFEKVSVPVLGLVENMSAFVCPDCGRREAIFGSGGVESLGRELGLDVLAEIPLAASTRAHGDAGTPDVVAEPTGIGARAFFELAHRAMVAVSARPLDYSRKFGRINVQAPQTQS